MSKEEELTGFTIVEKFLALIIILVGAIVVHSATTSPRLAYPILFAVGGLALIVLGAFMILAKTH